MRLHATCVVIAGRGVLLRGASGSGKSDLALRLVDAGARLVADDQVLIERDGDTLVASPPETLAGRIEVRGVGIVPVPAVSSAPLVLVADLVPGAAVDRLPEPESVAFLGIALPLVRIAPFEASAPAKLRLAVSVQPAPEVPVGPEMR